MGDRYSYGYAKRFGGGVMGFEIWWDKNSGRSIQPNSNLKTACRYAYNDALMENGGKIKELEDKLKIAVDVLIKISNTPSGDTRFNTRTAANEALEKIGGLK